MKTFGRATFTEVVVALGVLTTVVLIPAAAPGQTTSGQSPAVRDGSHDFDFIYGKWRMPNRHLKKRLAGSHEWDEFVTCDEASALPGGVGDIDHMKASFWKDFVGVSI